MITAVKVVAYIGTPLHQRVRLVESGRLERSQGTKPKEEKHGHAYDQDQEKEGVHDRFLAVE